ncbi:hypothetical protein [Glutamicibacter creatinolyticus]|uniref:hypothetical protein n=1 Tax=Glutamicibacter creatinolyticus TaxID=162496 RepID=UPI003216D29B
MRKSQVVLRFDDDQVEELRNALCFYREHVLEQLQDAYQFEGAGNSYYWSSKLSTIQCLVESVNSSGSQLATSLVEGGKIPSFTDFYEACS